MCRSRWRRRPSRSRPQHRHELEDRIEPQITWSHNLGTGEAVNITLSRDNGATWTTIAASVVNTTSTNGSFTWNVTGPATTTARIRVTWTQIGSVTDVSNVNFGIN